MLRPLSSSSSSSSLVSLVSLHRPRGFVFGSMKCTDASFHAMRCISCINELTLVGGCRVSGAFTPLAVGKKKPYTPSVCAVLPSPSVCFLSSRILNFWIKFQDGQNTRLFLRPHWSFFSFLPGYHVKHHMEQIKPGEQEEEEEEEEGGSYWSLPSLSTGTITSATGLGLNTTVNIYTEAEPESSSGALLL